MRHRFSFVWIFDEAMRALDAVQSSGYGPAKMTDRNDISTIDSTRGVRAWWWPVV